MGLYVVSRDHSRVVMFFFTALTHAHKAPVTIASRLRFDCDSTIHSTASEKVGVMTVAYVNEGTNPDQTTLYFRDVGCKRKHFYRKITIDMDLTCC